MNNEVLEAAQNYRKAGWRVIALHGIDEGGFCTCGRARCNSQGKHPVEARWQETPPLSGPDVQALFEEGDRNVGLATGDPSGFWVLDIDLDKPGTGERLNTLRANRDLGPTRVIKTPGGGYHYYFTLPDFNVTNSAKRLPDGIDVRGNGGQVVAPPSRSNKGVYTVVRDVPIAPAPDWLLDLVRPLPPAAPVDLTTVPKLTDLPESEQTRLQRYTDQIFADEAARLVDCKTRGWSGPGWNNTTFEVACTLVELANSPWCRATLESVHDFLLRNAPRDAHFDDAEIEGCFASALKTVDGKGRALPEAKGPTYEIVPGDPLTDPSAASPVDPPAEGGADGAVVARAWTDLGNAQRMVDLYGQHLRYVREAEDWAVYEEGAWRLAGGPAGRALAQDMVENLFDREGHLYDNTRPEEDEPSMREKFAKWAYTQQSSAKISACLKEATGRRELVVDMSAFDQDPHLMNVANGVVDLRTGEISPHDPDRLMMLQSPVRYDPDAEAPLWDAFLARCLPDPAVRTFLQKATGYSLTGLMDEQALFIHHGPGANGKSVFLVIASHIAGSYGQVVPRETLLAKSSSNTEHPTSVARMRGRRFLQASETAAGRRLDEETVKGLTGGEQQTARFMGRDFFDFTPTGKIHFVTNHLPRLTDAESIWRRLHLIGWRETIPVAERDPRLASKIIEAEAEGVLAWAVRGAVRWYAERLAATDSMRADLADYRTDQDLLGEFVADRLVKDEVAFSATSEIYGAYSAWCFQSGIRNPLTSPDLSRALRERGFTPHRHAKSRGFRCTIAPVQSFESSDPLLTR